MFVFVVSDGRFCSGSVGAWWFMYVQRRVGVYRTFGEVPVAIGDCLHLTLNLCLLCSFRVLRKFSCWVKNHRTWSARQEILPNIMQSWSTLFGLVCGKTRVLQSKTTCIKELRWRLRCSACQWSALATKRINERWDGARNLAEFCTRMIHDRRSGSHVVEHVERSPPIYFRLCSCAIDDCRHRGASGCTRYHPRIYRISREVHDQYRS